MDNNNLGQIQIKTTDNKVANLHDIVLILNKPVESPLRITLQELFERAANAITKLERERDDALRRVEELENQYANLDWVNPGYVK